MTEPLVAIAAFTESMEADLARIHLKAEGIESRLDDENSIEMHWLNTSAMGSIKLLVRESEAERAVEILNRKTVEGIAENDAKEDGFSEEGTGEEEPQHHPS